mmetsp:Transcript_3189/g.9247  ORF Transcript_3189/g.9247 Transcript_3189/m.9247 type:complete len:206 (-) Transcript_3189:497-1114(-)
MLGTSVVLVGAEVAFTARSAAAAVLCVMAPESSTSLPGWEGAEDTKEAARWLRCSTGCGATIGMAPPCSGCAAPGARAPVVELSASAGAELPACCSGGPEDGCGPDTATCCCCCCCWAGCDAGALVGAGAAAAAEAGAGIEVATVGGGAEVAGAGSSSRVAASLVVVGPSSSAGSVMPPCMHISRRLRETASASLRDWDRRPFWT